MIKWRSCSTHSVVSFTADCRSPTYAMNRRVVGPTKHRRLLYAPEWTKRL